MGTCRGIGQELGRKEQANGWLQWHKKYRACFPCWEGLEKGVEGELIGSRLGRGMLTEGRCQVGGQAAADAFFSQTECQTRTRRQREGTSSTASSFIPMHKKHRWSTFQCWICLVSRTNTTERKTSQVRELSPLVKRKGSRPAEL